MKFLKTTTNLHWWLNALLILQLLCLPFSMSLPVLLMIPMVGVLAALRFQNKIKWRPIPHVTLWVLWVVIIVWCQAIFNGSFITDFTYYKKEAILLVMLPLLSQIPLRTKFLQAFLMMSLAAIVFSCIKIAIYFYFYRQLPLHNGWAVNQMMPLDRPFMGFMCVIGFLMALFLAQKRHHSQKIYCTIAAVFVIYTVLIVARVALISIAISLFFGVVTQFKSYKKRLFIIFVLMGLFLLGIQYSYSDRLWQLLNWEHEPRYFLWKCAWNGLFQHDFSLLFGTENYTEMQNSLHNCLQINSSQSALQSYLAAQSFNWHNQFLEVFYRGGFVALLPFVIFWIVLFYNHKKDFFAISFLISALLFMLVENVLQRQVGCFLWIYGYYFFLNNTYGNNYKTD